MAYFAVIEQDKIKDGPEFFQRHETESDRNGTHRVIQRNVKGRHGQLLHLVSANTGERTGCGDGKSTCEDNNMDADLHDPAMCGRNFFDVYFQGSGYQGLSGAVSTICYQYFKEKRL